VCATRFLLEKQRLGELDGCLTERAKELIAELTELERRDVRT
jgi:hypothetical protein